ncbi:MULTISPECIES: hypothetical protein [unclassified Streptomyces]|uniref:hypothetical protein n=1 Tax=unclassified Streptomyces TaxID=2593676 RepID=UPI0037F378CB
MHTYFQEYADNPDSDVLYRDQEARADAAEERRRAAEREARRPVGKRCGQKLTDQRWAETTARGGGWSAGNLSVRGTCHVDDVAREEAAAKSVCLRAAAPPEPDDDPEEERGHGWFRRRP